MGQRTKRQVGIDETSDQPRAGNAHHLGARTRHPDGSPGLITRRQFIGAKERLAALNPIVVAALERLRVDSLMPEPGGRALA
jgi:hypothetical protein